METFGEKNQRRARLVDSGLLWKMMMMNNNYDDTNREIAFERILAWQTGGR